MKNFKIKMTAISPLHIGTGEDFDPTTFIIDAGERYLYEFDETRFFTQLDEMSRKQFIEHAENEKLEALFNLHTFIKNHKDAAKKAVRTKVQVSKGIASDYEKKVGRAVQLEGKQKQKVFNRFQIARTLRLPNLGKVYVPGSSIKGSIATAIQEAFYKENPLKYKEAFEVRNPSMSFMKNLLVSDSIPLKTYAIIGYALNKERFEDDEQGPSTKLEVIYSDSEKNSEFEFNVSFREYEPKRELGIEEIITYSNAHYLPLFRAMMESYTTFRGKEVDDFTNEYFDEKFYDKYKDFELKPNQFLLRVGKHSGARAVTIEGMRQIRVKVSGGGPRRKPNKWETLDQETTTWLFGLTETDTKHLLPFGWVLCEVIDGI